MSEVLCVALNPAIDQTIEITQLRVGSVNRATRAQQDAGGKGVNVASCLADYGVATAVVALLGQENPALFESLFDAKRIENHSFYLDGATRINIKLVDPAGEETTDINLPGPILDSTQIAKRIVQIREVISTLARSVRWLVLSGSLPPGWPVDIYATLIEHAHSVGMRVLLDTSGAPFGAALAAGPDIVKPNRDELAMHLGRNLEDMAATLAAARDLLATCTGLGKVVVSMGNAGAVLATRKEAVLAHPLPVAAISSVGAGDAMVAGLIAAELQTLSLADGARLATAFAAGKLTRLGPHLPGAAEVQTLARQVVLSVLS
jgi:1-phosphofructokinase